MLSPASHPSQFHKSCHCASIPVISPGAENHLICAPSCATQVRALPCGTAGHGPMARPVPLGDSKMASALGWSH